MLSYLGLAHIAYIKFCTIIFYFEQINDHDYDIIFISWNRCRCRIGTTCMVLGRKSRGLSLPATLTPLLVDLLSGYPSG